MNIQPRKLEKALHTESKNRRKPGIKQNLKPQDPKSVKPKVVSLERLQKLRNLRLIRKRVT